jgi:hypothetical protein
MAKQNEKPVIFNSEMVRAILDGRKKQTRRIIKPQPNYQKRFGEPKAEIKVNIANRKCPYGQVGDTLWVRESFRIPNMDFDKEQALMVHYYSDRSYCSVDITNDEMKLWKARKKPFAKTPGRFMYKSLARIFLEITNIRVERVQDISENDAEAEGTNCNRTYREDFKNLWDSINAKRGYDWDKNPWVWVVEFRKLTK